MRRARLNDWFTTRIFASLRSDKIWLGRIILSPTWRPLPAKRAAQNEVHCLDSSGPRVFGFVSPPAPRSVRFREIEVVAMVGPAGSFAPAPARLALAGCLSAFRGPAAVAAAEALANSATMTNSRAAVASTATPRLFFFSSERTGPTTQHPSPPRLPPPSRKPPPISVLRPTSRGCSS